MCTGRWPRSPTPGPIPTGGPGTGRRLRPGPTRTSPRSLKRSAGRAQARGGLAAAASLSRTRGAADSRTRSPGAAAARGRARQVRCGCAGCGAGAAGRGGKPGRLTRCGPRKVEHLRGQIASQQRRSSDGARLLLKRGPAPRAARCRPGPRDLPGALAVAVWAGGLGPSRRRAGKPPRPRAPRRPPPTRPRVADVLLDALALRLTEGYTAAAPTMAQAVELVLGLDAAPDLEANRGLWLAGAGASQMGRPGAVGRRILAPPWPLAWPSSPATRARWCSCSSGSTSSPSPTCSPASWPRRRG